MTTTAKITFLLRQMSANATMLGYTYTIQGVEKIVEDESYLHHICKLYQDVGKENNSTGDKVERCIRALVNSVVKTESGRKTVERLSGHKLERTPTCGQFLEMLAFGAQNFDMFQNPVG